MLTKWHSVTGDAERYSQRRKYLRDAHNFELNLFFCIIEFDIWTENNIEQTNILCPLIILLICILIYIAKAVKKVKLSTCVWYTGSLFNSPKNFLLLLQSPNSCGNQRLVKSGDLQQIPQVLSSKAKFPAEEELSPNS